MARLAAEFWVQAYLARIQAEGLGAYLLARGDPVAGAVVVKCAFGDGRARAFQRVQDLTGGRRWDVLAEGPEAEVDAALVRARSRDPDLWLIEVEDRSGLAMLDAPGLDD
ncbi:MAG: DUF1491 family protein [Gemmobacter sp.]